MLQFFRLIFRLIALILLTVVLLPLQFLALAGLPRVARSLPTLYHQLTGRVLGLRIKEEGQPAAKRPLLVVANHVSWLDISVISAALPVSFVAKQEVRSWPVFGLFSKLQRSIFIDRTRRQQSAAANSEIAARLVEGDAIVLFAEGTSSDGKDVLPFRSALIGAATEACAQSAAGNVLVQPLSISYAGEARDLVPWYGDMDLAPHFVRVLQARSLQAVLSWGEPVVYSGQSNRKQITKELEENVRTLTRRALAEHG